MPHWINLSFYSTNKKIPYSTFIPRIKLPQKVSKHSMDNGRLNCKTKLLQEDPRECLHNSLFDYDAYDAQVFQLPHVHTSRYYIPLLSYIFFSFYNILYNFNF